MSRDESNSGITMLSFLTGTVIGAAVTLLMAPKTGKEIREMLAAYSEDIKKKTTDFTDDFRGHTESAIDQGKELIEKGRAMISRGTNMLDHGKDYIDDKKKTLSAAIEAGKEAMEKEHETIEETAQKGKKKG